MNVAGPSRVPASSGQLAPRERVESAYEEDLLGLLSRLTLDEMDEMQTLFTQRTRAGDPLSDRDMAMNDLLQQARAQATFNQDRVLAERIAAEEDVGVEQTLEQRPGAVPQPNGNRMAAQQNGNQHAVQTARNHASPSRTPWKKLRSVVAWAFRTKLVPEPRPTIASTDYVVPRAPVVIRPTGHDCVICQDPIRGAEIRAPCGHYYGIDCVTDLFQSATQDETLFPPRCCRQNIPFVQVQPHLSQTLITTFRKKQAEFSTLKRVYCSSPTCSRFLGPLSEGTSPSKVYACPAPGCGRRTCAKCREQHSGDWAHACRPDADAAQVIELGHASGWARCPGCSQMIELHMGCFHMTCRCRTEFCYLCRAQWKTCQCLQWDERRLLAAAEERVDAQLEMGREWGARPPVPAPAPAQGQAPPPLPPRPLAPARAPAVDILYPLPTPVRTPTTSSSTGRPANTASTLPRERMIHKAKSLQSTHPAFVFTRTTTSMAISARELASTSASRRSTVRPKSVHNPDFTRQRLVREMMERLRVDHECDHRRWHYRSGGGICQTCGDYLRLYLYRCNGCEMLACKRCKHNRL